MLTPKTLAMHAETASEEFNKTLKVAYMMHSTCDVKSVLDNEDAMKYADGLAKIGILKKDQSGAISGIDYGLFGLDDNDKNKVGVLELYTKILERAYNVTYK